MLGEWVREYNQALFATRFTRKFKPVPRGNLEAMVKEADNPTESDINSHFISSGYVSFFTYGRIRSAPKSKLRLSADDWLNLEIGYSFYISTGALADDRQNPTRVALYAAIEGRELPYLFRETTYKASFPSEAQAFRLLQDRIARVRDAALKTAPGAYAEALAGFRVPGTGRR
jgi:hypothetical protein